HAGAGGAALPAAQQKQKEGHTPADTGVSGTSFGCQWRARGAPNGSTSGYSAVAPRGQARLHQFSQPGRSDRQTTLPTRGARQDLHAGTLRSLYSPRAALENLDPKTNRSKP